MNQEYIAAEMFRRMEEGFPSMSEEHIDYSMRMISAMLRGQHLDALREEAQSEVDRATLCNTGAQLLENFEQYRGLDTLKKAVDVLGRAVALFPQGHRHRGVPLNNLVKALMAQYKQDNDSSKLPRIVDLHREALLLRPQGHPDRAISLNNLANTLMRQYEQDGDTSKLAETVDRHQEVLSLHPEGHPNHALSLNNLTIALIRQYEQDGDTSKLAETVDRHRKALSLRSEGHPDRAILLGSLATTLMTQYEHDGDMSKLVETVNRRREALSLRPQGHPNRADSLNGLANALMRQHEQDGDMSKLAETVNHHREALALRPKGHPDRVNSLNNLASALIRQYEQDGDTSKLAETVDRLREALPLRPQGHPTRAISLNNLANTLMKQYEEDGDMSKLAEMIDRHREALSLRPEGHPDRTMSLDNLATALMKQYEQDGDTAKLAEAVDRYREALSLHPQGHPGHGNSLNNLANSYYAQYECTGSESALLKALKLRRGCLSSRPPGHPNRYAAHHSIARVQLLDTSLFNWAEALDHLMQAMMDNSASPRLRLIQAIQSLRHVETASARNPEQYFYSQQALDLYVEAIQLLPRAAHVGLDISARLRALSGSEQLCRAAAMRAVLLERLPAAVEVFEEGKAVFWSQALRLRFNALNELPTADDERLRHLFRELDSENSDRSTEGLEKVDLERHIEHRRQLNDQADRLIEEIRRRPGLERFLRIPQYEQLARAASNGYVVALVANEPIYFAIIIQADKAPQSVLLSSVNGEKLRRLIELTSGSGMRDAVDRGVVKERVPPHVPLERMWRIIVEPVLLHLGLQVRYDRLT
jgi:tetratricopeptide (TPR) repeat protein